MSRKLSELQEECMKNGLKFAQRASKEQLEDMLRDFYWDKETKGDPSIKMLKQIEPQAAHNIKDLSDEERAAVLASPRYWGQVKLDGARFIMFVGKDKNRFTSRRKSDKDYRYSEKTDNFCYHRDFIVPGFENSVFDGEMKMPVAQVDSGNGKLTVAELQATVVVTNSGPDKAKTIQDKYAKIVYHIFDCLEYKGRDVRDESYEKRYEYVKEFFKAIESIPGSIELFKFVESVVENKLEFYEKVVKDGGEGIMLKDKESKYEEGKRTWSWLKIKRFEEFDTIVTGFDEGDFKNGFRGMVGNLNVSCYDEDGVLREMASVSAMPLEFRKAITVVENGKVGLRKDIYGKILVVRGQEFQKNMRLKHAVAVPYKSWDEPFRDDKNEKDCVFSYKKIKEKLAAGLRI